MLRVLPSHQVAAATRSRIPGDRIAPQAQAQLDETRAQHKVFLRLCTHYEDQCRKSGLAESPALCAAADRFHRERSLTALIEFADILDRIDIPAPSPERKRWA